MRKSLESRDLMTEKTSGIAERSVVYMEADKETLLENSMEKLEVVREYPVAEVLQSEPSV